MTRALKTRTWKFNTPEELEAQLAEITDWVGQDCWRVAVAGIKEHLTRVFWHAHLIYENRERHFKIEALGKDNNCAPYQLQETDVMCVHTRRRMKNVVKHLRNR